MMITLLHHPIIAVSYNLMCFALAGGAAYMFLRRNKPATGLGFLLIAAFLLRMYAASDLYLHPWDERYHATVAKNMMDHPFRPTLYEDPVYDVDYREWGSNHIWLHKPPMSLWLISASLRLFGEHEVAVRFPSILMNTLSVLLLYSIGRMLTDSRSAFLAAVLLATSGSLLDLVGGRAPVDHIDVTLLFFTLLGIWFAGRHIQTEQKKYLVGMGASAGLAVLTKSFPGLFLIGVWGFWSLAEKKNLVLLARDTVIAVFIAMAISLPWNLYTKHQWPEITSWVTRYSLIHLTEALEGHDHPWYFYLSELGRRISEIVYIPLLWFMLMLVKKPAPKEWTLFIWFVTPTVLFSLAATKMPAYMAISWPAIYLIYASIWWRGVDLLFGPSPASGLKKGLLWCFLILAVLTPLRLSVERLDFYKLDRDANPEWARQLRTLGNELSGTNPVVIFNTGHPIEAMFYTDATAYSIFPTRQKVEDLLERGVDVVILERGDLPSHLQQLRQQKVQTDLSGAKLQFIPKAY
jgi:4-amino-4-deoxy-L-arabinose transferase